MPLVLATGAPTASGHNYNDVLGRQYEFPLRYRNLVQPGEPFVYYMGRRGTPTGQPIYFGAGVVGDVAPSPSTGQLIAQVHDVEIFDEPILAKASDGNYLETGSTTATNWASGVRRIDEATLGRILSSTPTAPDSTQDPPRAGQPNADVTHAGALERYSVGVALSLLAAEFGAAAVNEMPPGNPGYDVLVTRALGDLHVEIKGTVLPDPVFHLSEGQRRHAEAHGTNFRLIVVYNVDRQAKTHQVVVVDGPLDAGKVDLHTEAWTGRVLPKPSPGDRAV